MKTNLKILFVLFLCVAVSVRINAQQVSIKPFSVGQSKVIDELKRLKTNNPKITTEELLKTGNALLDKQGLNFIVGFDTNTCQKIGQIKAAQKTPNAPLNLRTTIKSPLGEAASLLLPEAVFAKNECFPCFVALPFLEITNQDFVTVVEGNNLKFFLPANFFVNEIFLVDEKDLTTIKKKWKIPFKTVPLSISDDGNILFLGFEEPELSDLALAIFSAEGAYQFYAKKDLDSAKKGTILTEKQIAKTVPNFSFVKFETPELKQIVKFPIKCPN